MIHEINHLTLYMPADKINKLSFQTVEKSFATHLDSISAIYLGLSTI